MAVRGDDPGSADDPWVELRLGLLALAPLEDEAAAETALLDGGRPRFDWWAATWVAMRLESPDLRPVLRRGRTDDAHSRALAARGLGALADASSVETLAALARDPSEAVAFEALRAHSPTSATRRRIGGHALLGSPSDVVRRQALRRFWRRSRRDPGPGPRLVRLVGERAPWIRAAALAALARTDRDNFALVLSGLDPDPCGG